MIAGEASPPPFSIHTLDDIKLHAVRDRKDPRSERSHNGRFGRRAKSS